MSVETYLKWFHVESPAKEAAREVQSFRQHIAEYPRCMDPLSESRERRAVHCIELGEHVDPDLGRWYVEPKKQLTLQDKSLVAKRHKKVRLLSQAVSDRIASGEQPEVVQAFLKSEQKYECVVLTVNDVELEKFLVEVFTNGDLLPGQIEGGYADLTPLDDWFCEWCEGLSCAGGVTSRYNSVMLESSGGY